MDQKKDIRNNVLKLRNSIDPICRSEKSKAIFAKIINSKNLQDADNIFCYVNFGSEVETTLFIEEMWSLHKKILLPKVVGQDMAFYYINNWSQMIDGYKGIKEPDVNQNLSVFHINDETSSNREKNMMIMPGVAFDKERNRMGYGGGFYDRYLAKTENKIALYKILVAFDAQYTEDVKSEIHDVKPEIIVTESKVWE